VERGLASVQEVEGESASENRIRLSFEAFSLYVEAVDKARADFRILVINFAGIPLSVQHVELHWWRLAIGLWLNHQSS